MAQDKTRQGKAPTLRDCRTSKELQNELRQWAQLYLRETVNVTWEPVIERKVREYLVIESDPHREVINDLVEAVGEAVQRAREKVAAYRAIGQWPHAYNAPICLPPLELDVAEKSAPGSKAAPFRLERLEPIPAAEDENIRSLHGLRHARDRLVRVLYTTDALGDGLKVLRAGAAPTVLAAVQLIMAEGPFFDKAFVSYGRSGKCSPEAVVKAEAETMKKARKRFLAGRRPG